METVCEVRPNLHTDDNEAARLPRRPRSNAQDTPSLENVGSFTSLNLHAEGKYVS
jgi:hypothetical protein